MTQVQKSPDCDLIIFGAKGDLANRKLFPSLYRLDQSNLLHEKTRIIGIGRAAWNVDDFCERVKQSLKKFLNNVFDYQVWKKFSARLDFCNIDVNYLEQFVKLSEKLNQKKRITIYYFAMLPEIFGVICKGLGKVNLNNKSSRIIIEKPQGHDLNSFYVINKQISEYFHENQIYRIDHYLGKETIINLLILRFANYLFLNNWDHRSIDHVQITLAEEIGIENRWNYFNNTGQMRDMVQNHLLQILTILTMSPPDNLNFDCIVEEKLKILRALKPIDNSNINNVIVRGQYIAGLVNGNSVPGYLNETNSHKHSDTETFVSIRVDINNWQWAGVPFYLRTGKRLPCKRSEIVIYFKRPIYNLFSKYYKHLSQNKLIIRLEPNEGIDIEIINKVPNLDSNIFLQNVKLNFNIANTFYNKNITDAYDRLLLEVINGVKTLFVSYNEVEECWKWVDPIIKLWATENHTLKFYQAGTWGPNESFSLLARDGRVWNCY